MNETIRNILGRRSVRSFKQEQFSDADLELILKAGLYAPSARNTQAWHFTALRNRSAIDALTVEVKAATARMPENRYKEMVAKGSYRVNYGAPSFIIVAIDTAVSRAPAADAALALGNMMLAAHSLGLGSCWINQLNVLNDEAGFRNHLALLGVPQGYDIYGCLALGYPERDLPAAAPRREGTVNTLT